MLSPFEAPGKNLLWEAFGAKFTGVAYRDGLIYGLMRDMDLPTTGRIASLMGALKIEHLGPQNQRFDYDEFAEHQVAYGYPAEVVAAAEAARDEVWAAATSGEGAFDGRAEGWLRTRFPWAR